MFLFDLIAWLFLILSIVLSVVSTVWWIIATVSLGVWWLIAYLFIPLVWLVFAFLHWDRAKGPFLTGLFAFLFALGTVFTAHKGNGSSLSFIKNLIGKRPLSRQHLTKEEHTKVQNTPKERAAVAQAYVLIKQGKPDEGLAVLKKASDENPEDGEILLSYAVVLHEKAKHWFEEGRKEEGKKLFEEDEAALKRAIQLLEGQKKRLLKQTPISGWAKFISMFIMILKKALDFTAPL